jgi:acyl-coenzyme A thioesterase PaaI-like protein
MDQLSAMISQTFAAGVPFSAHLGIKITEVIDGDEVSAKAIAPDLAEQRNHVGGPHAGVLFTLGETASGGVIMAAFREHPELLALPMTSQIAFKRIARGEPHAVAHLVGGRATVERMLAEYAAGTRPECDVAVEVSTAEGVCTELTVRWTLVPAKRG